MIEEDINNSFNRSPNRDKICLESMRIRIAIPAQETPLLKRFRHGWPDRGRPTSHRVI
jgi:hypothetical protein